MDIDDIIKEQINILEELNTLTDEELRICFPECDRLNDIIKSHPLSEINERIGRFTGDITKTATTVPTTTAVKIDERPDTMTLSWLLSSDKGYSDKEYDALFLTKEPKGIVFWYDHRRRMGFLYRRHKARIHKMMIMGKELPEDVSKKLRCGDIVSFKPQAESKFIVATDIVIKGHVASSTIPIELPGGSEIKPSIVTRYGLNNAFFELKRSLGDKFSEKSLKEHGYTKEDLDYVFIRTFGGGEYRIYKNTAPIKGNGQTEDLYKLLEILDKKVLAFVYNEKQLRYA